ncbi:MAG: T9SS type A sorting domain-containing protein [Bacteroidetes bacterium]|nr:T9SS type A sorting domain-containing protein [Bacteroidota bacterium]
MKKLTCLILLAVACCPFVQAQQAPDSSSNPGTETGSIPFVNFTAVVRESHKVWLQWDVDSAMEGDYFIIERSPDGSHYETIGALRSKGIKESYELTDIAPPNGANFYRIKYTGQSTRQAYSKVMQLSLSGEVDFRFYPNPVDKLFIVRTEHSIDIQVLDANGSVRLSKRLQPGIQVINASSLERGVYVLRVTDKESNRAISQQLLKN